MHQLTGDARWDAAGSILIGILLAGVAIFLISRNRDFLVGQEVNPVRRRTALEALLATAEIERVTFLHLEFVGPGKVLLIAAVDITGNTSEEHVARRLRTVSERIEERESVERAILTLSVPEDPSLEA
jgi:divalent metal cation (Fe/Co/Zn/Cd) transporter